VNKCLVFVFASCLPYLAAAAQDADPWTAPPEARKLKNRVPMTGEGLTAIAPVYERNCAKCHGVNGAANGSQAPLLSAEPANFTDIKMLKTATDGELLWKITQGRDPMPAFSQLPETERWQLVNYVRDLARHSQYRYLGVKRSR
jgi:mono/diheme cytochrome c family protein